MSRNIYSIGETVYDIIFQKGRIEAGKPGGSLLNSSVTLGRLCHKVLFISEMGNDDLGKVILDFLKTNNVNTDYVQLFDDGKTPVALAFLDENQNARYLFYKHYPAERLRQDLPRPKPEDIVLFGSIFSVSPDVREPVAGFARRSKEAGAILIHDPNIRKPHKNEIPKLLPMILENFALSDVVRASNEDFETIFGAGDGDAAFRIIRNESNAVLIFTRGSGHITLYTKDFTRHFDVPPVKIVSSIGAGDTFNAGIASSIIKMGIRKNEIADLPSEKWGEIIATGIALSKEVCLSYDNYISVR